MRNVIICCSVGDVINLKINCSFPFKLFLYKNKKYEQKCKYLNNGKSFRHKIKSIFHHFQRTFIKSNKNNSFGKQGSAFKIYADSSSNLPSLILELFHY